MQTISPHVTAAFLQGEVIARGVGRRVDGSILA